MSVSLNRLLTVIAAVAALCSCSAPKVYDVQLSGEGVDLFPDSSRVLVFHKGADIRFDHPVASAYLEEGSFNMSFRDSAVRQYELMFLGRSVSVFQLLFGQSAASFHFRQ